MTDPVEPQAEEEQPEREKLPKPIVRAFLLLTLVATVALGVMGWEIHVARDATAQNRVLVKNVAAGERKIVNAVSDVKVEKASVARVEKAQVDSCLNYETLRAAHNDFVGTIRKFLLTAARRNAQAARLTATSPDLRRQDLAAEKIYDELISNSHTVTASCAQKRAHPAKT